MTQTRKQSLLAAHFANQIKIRRKWIGVSAKEVADRCAEAGYRSLTREAISNIEVGRRQDITLDEAACLCHVLGSLEESVGSNVGPQPERSTTRITMFEYVIRHSVPLASQIDDSSRAWMADEEQWLHWRDFGSGYSLELELAGLLERLQVVQRMLDGDRGERAALLPATEMQGQEEHHGQHSEEI